MPRRPFQQVVAQPARCPRLAATAITATGAPQPAVAAAPAPAAPVQDVSVTDERLPKSQMRLTVTVSPRLCTAQYNKEIAYFQKNTTVPGFRKGGKKGKKVPDSMLLDTLGGSHKFKQSTVEQLLKRTLPLAFEPYKTRALEDSVNIVSEIDELVGSWEDGQPLVFQVAFDTMPEVSWKSSYRELKVEVASVGDEATDAAEIEAKLLSLRKESGTLRVVTGRGVRRGDTVICDFDAERADIGEPILGARQAGMQLDTDTTDKTFLPGLADSMAGMVQGDVREITVTIPDTWETERLRGVPARCTVKVSEVFEWELPELSDEFAEERFPGCGGAEGLRRELLNVEAADRSERQMMRIQEALTEAVANIAVCDVPESLVRQMGEGEYQATLIQLQQKSNLGMEQLAQLATEEMLDNFISNKYSDLEDMQRSVLAFDAIYQQEGLSLAEGVVEAEFKNATEDFQRQEQDYDEERLMDQVRETLKGLEVLELLRKTCDIKIV